MPRVNVKDRRRQQLIDANMNSIARRGYADTTITHVSEGAGMSRGIVNFYFNTKESMMKDTLRYLVEDYTRQWQEAVESKKEFSAEEQLQSLIDVNFDRNIASHKRLVVWSAFWGHATSHKDYSRIIQAGDEAHITAIATLWEKIVGDKRRMQTNFPQQLHGMIRGMWLMLLLSPDLYDTKSLTQICQRALHETIHSLSVSRPEPRLPEKVVDIAEAKTGKKKDKLPAPSGKQLDFADLFGG